MTHHQYNLDEIRQYSIIAEEFIEERKQDTIHLFALAVKIVEVSGGGLAGIDPEKKKEQRGNGKGIPQQFC